MRRHLVAFVACLALAACVPPSEDTGSGGSCPSGSFSCGNPAGGPECCGTGNSCCFGYNTCCDSNYPHLGVRRSDGAKRCYQTLAGEGSTWDLLTVCGVPAG
jgi:hypothetical protein